MKPGVVDEPASSGGPRIPQLEADRIVGAVLDGRFTTDGPLARSIVAYGNSMRPESPHYDDQAEMFAQGLMKPVFFRMEDILANLAESYRPGEPRFETQGEPSR